jgi:hypothetical protein
MSEKKTNDQIALELAQKDCNIQEQICSRHVGAMAMAEYKDKQVKEAICRRYRLSVNQTVADALEGLYRDLFDDDIINEAFK